MTFPKGQWTTEYGIQWGRPHEVDSEPRNLEEAKVIARVYRDNGWGSHIVTRQTFHGEWQPLPERTNT